MIYLFYYPQTIYRKKNTLPWCIGITMGCERNVPKAVWRIQRTALVMAKELMGIAFYISLLTEIN